MLPWKGFNKQGYNPADALGWFEVGQTPEGLESVSEYHPNPFGLSRGARSMMCRNYHQIHGYGDLPMVSFVVCCADSSGLGVKGGTGQAVRIARDLDIPVINIREDRWQDKLKTICLENVNG